MKKKVHVGVLISGRGSNLQALVDATREPGYPAEIVLVISNAADAFGLERAKRVNIPTLVIPHNDFSSREDFDDALDVALRAAGVEFICLAGFMRMLSEKFVRAWEGKIINIHPSLLPDFKGVRVHERVLEAGVVMSGCTAHFVVPELDSGPIILQAEVPVQPEDTVETLSTRVLKQEHVIYPMALRMVAEGRVRLEGGCLVKQEPA
ncbi:MAG: phosphoribosylglycinamide formyltransferase [Alphaproteobacteria bacterium]